MGDDGTKGLVLKIAEIRYRFNRSGLGEPLTTII